MISNQGRIWLNYKNHKDLTKLSTIPNETLTLKPYLLHRSGGDPKFGASGEIHF